jgi:hypothetical protein
MSSSRADSIEIRQPRPRCGICLARRSKVSKCRKACFHLSETRPCCTVPRALPRPFQALYCIQRSCIHHDPFEFKVPRCAYPNRTDNSLSLPHFSQLAFTLSTKASEICFASTVSAVWASEFDEFRCLHFTSSSFCPSEPGFSISAKARISDLLFTS